MVCQQGEEWTYISPDLPDGLFFSLWINKSLFFTSFPFEYVSYTTGKAGHPQVTDSKTGPWVLTSLSLTLWVSVPER